MVLLGLAESYRVNGGPLGEGPDAATYPGGAFDPLGLADDPDTFAELRVRRQINVRRLCRILEPLFGCIHVVSETGRC